MTIAIVIWIVLYLLGAIIVWEMVISGEHRPSVGFVGTAVMFSLLWPIPIGIILVRLFLKGKRK